MTIEALSSPRRHAPSAVHTFISLIVSLRGMVHEWLQRRRDIQLLQSLDDRMLADIGVSRSGIPAYVHGVDCRHSRGARY